MSARFPALGFDPVPGDPDAVARTGSRLRRVADDLGHQAGVLQRAAGLTASWQGSAACAYAGRLAERVAELRTAAEVLGTASQALLRHAADLRDLQETARRLERAAVPASTAVCLPGAATELEVLRAPALGLREQAEHAARRVTQEVRRAAEASPAARRFDGWSDTPLGIPVGRWAAEHEDALDAVGDRAGLGGAVLTVGAVAAGVVSAPVVAALALPLGLGAGVATGVAFLAHGGAAHFGDGAVSDVALDVAGLGAFGVAVRAGSAGLPALARLGDRVGQGLAGWTLGGGGVTRLLPDPGRPSGPPPRPATGRDRHRPRRNPALERLLVGGVAG
jgi:uncharacterized protein YukE